METHRVERKLAAILHADVKGYSRLIGEDEVETLRVLGAYLERMNALVQPTEAGTMRLWLRC
jgi:class 3 adenylate cyclase